MKTSFMNTTRLKGQRISGLLLSGMVFSGMMFSFSTLASTTPEHCYALGHGEDGLGSSKSMYLPHLITNNDWEVAIMVTNTSNAWVNVKIHFKDYEGLDYILSNYTLKGAWNSANSPLTAAILKPNETARLAIKDPNNDIVLNSRISWQANSCIDSALLVSVRSTFSSSTRLASSLELMNDGKPF